MIKKVVNIGSGIHIGSIALYAFSSLPSSLSAPLYIINFKIYMPCSYDFSSSTPQYRHVLIILRNNFILTVQIQFKYQNQFEVTFIYNLFEYLINEHKITVRNNCYYSSNNINVIIDI